MKSLELDTSNHILSHTHKVHAPGAETDDMVVSEGDKMRWVDSTVLGISLLPPSRPESKKSELEARSAPREPSDEMIKKPVQTAMKQGRETADYPGDLNSVMQLHSFPNALPF